MKKRIAIIHYSYPPVIGGVEFIISAHAKVLSQKGYSVKIITGSGAETDKNIDVRIIKNFLSSSPKVKLAQKELNKGEISRNFNELKNSLKRDLKNALRNVQICFIHNVLTMHFNLALTAALHEIIAEDGGQRAFYIWCHDSVVNNPQYCLPHIDIYPWNLLKTKLSFARYIAISEKRQSELSRIFKTKTSLFRVIPDGIDAKSFLGITDELWAFAEKSNLFTQDIIIFFPSRILRRKNYELAVRITKELCRKKIKCILLLTGAPDPHNPEGLVYFRELCRLIKKLKLSKNVVFLFRHLSQVGYRELQNIYDLSDILLITSTQEGFCLPLLEASSKKIPICCPGEKPFTEIVGKKAILFKLNEPAAKIAARIAAALSHSPAYHLSKKFFRQYCWKCIYEKYLRRLTGK